MRAFVFVAIVGCADETPRHATQARPIDEPRAQQVIAQTSQSENIDPEGGRTVSLGGGKPVKLEVAATGHKFGVVWVTREVQTQLSAILPAHTADQASLVLLEGAGADHGVHVVALYETDYMTDDLEGEAHSSTEIAAERRLERDVKDFLLKAKTEGW